MRSTQARRRKGKSRKRACEGKQQHPTKEQAYDHAFSLRRRGATAAQSDVYKCVFGNHWHVGHKHR